MPDKSYPFLTYSGLLEPRHYKQIGTAIWLFLWCISSTTKEVEKDGIVWGIVLGNKPMKLSEISQIFGVNEKTVSRWLDTLEAHEYIRVTRASRGLILSVRNSKKWPDKNVRSLESEQTEMSDHSIDEKTNMSDHLASDKTEMSDQSCCEQTNLSDREQSSGSDRTEMSGLKDIITTTTITTGEDWIEEITLEPRGNGMIAILDAYCNMHGRLDIHVKPHERDAMGRMVAGGIPVPFTISTMESLLQAKRDREGNRFKPPTSFLYYVDGIEEAWLNSQAISPQVTVVAQGAPTSPKRLSKQQRELEDLRRRAKEARQRGQG
ncbi:helix-turn-helix domain-containing protein [Paenibacillus thiaminolyticus]|uniref:helix-turn-helix domain-containing protein n=1 Tax=Paenibacillus thiaminolyticus TaxID=49283 RepID=UPI003D26716B